MVHTLADCIFALQEDFSLVDIDERLRILPKQKSIFAYAKIILLRQNSIYAYANYFCLAKFDFCLCKIIFA